jgi:spore maturation protein CgeB
MSKKIDFLMPVMSQYMALHNFQIKIYESFVRKGYSCRLINPDDFFTIPITDPPDMTFAINGVPFNGDRKMLCDVIKKPHFSYLIDPPYRFYDIIGSPNIYIGCDDRYGCEFLGEMGFEEAYFLPHGVDQNLAPDPSVEKDIDILMLSTFIDPEALRNEWTELFPKIVCLVMDDAIEITLSDDHTSFMKAFSDSYQDRLGLNKKPERIGHDLILPLMLLERYIKGKERVDLIKSITDAKVVLLNGHADGQPGWEKVLGDDYPNITLHSPVNYEEGVEYMKRSKIVLNSFSKNKEGGHDRVYNGMACGALVMSNENIFLNESFEDEKNILFFQTNCFEGVNEKLNKYLANENLRREIAEAGRKEVMAHHTWDHRIDSLSELWEELLG